MIRAEHLLTSSLEPSHLALLARRANEAVALDVVGKTLSVRFEDAAADFNLYRDKMKIAVPTALYNSEQWSLFNPKVHEAHYAALRQALASRQKPQ